MLGRVFGGMCIISIVYGAFSGTLTELGGAVFDGAEGAVTLTLSLCGIMCLWSGIMSLLRDAGAIKLLSGLISPLLLQAMPADFPECAC